MSGLTQDLTQIKSDIIAAKAAADAAGVGVGQTWQDVKVSRSASTLYTNTTGKPIIVQVHGSRSGVAGDKSIRIEVDSIRANEGSIYTATTAGTVGYTATAVVPNLSTYKAVLSGFSLSGWKELRA